MKRFVSVFATLVFTTSATAQIYQWKDESGRTIISDKPPVGHVRQQKQPSSEAPAPTAATGQKSLSDRDMEFRKRQKDAQEKAAKTEKDQASTTEKQEQCASMRRHLQSLESGERIARRDDSGERYFLDDTQREQETVKVRESIQSNCR